MVFGLAIRLIHRRMLPTLVGSFSIFSPVKMLLPFGLSGSSTRTGKLHGSLPPEDQHHPGLPGRLRASLGKLTGPLGNELTEFVLLKMQVDGRAFWPQSVGNSVSQ